MTTTVRCLRHATDRLPARATINRLGWMLGLLGTAAAILIAFNPGRIVLQARTEHSVAFRLGLRLSTPAVWQLGDLVQFSTRDLGPYYSTGTIFTKAVAGGPGDRLFRLGRDFYVNGVFVATARRTDAQGHPATLFTPPPTPALQCPIPLPWAETIGLPGAVHDCVLPAGALFVLGSHPRSFDSRYWGFVHQPEILGRVLALF